MRIQGVGAGLRFHGQPAIGGHQGGRHRKMPLCSCTSFHGGKDPIVFNENSGSFHGHPTIHGHRSAILVDDIFPPRTLSRTASNTWSSTLLSRPRPCGTFKNSRRYSPRDGGTLSRTGDARASTSCSAGLLSRTAGNTRASAPTPPSTHSSPGSFHGRRAIREPRLAIVIFRTNMTRSLSRTAGNTRASTCADCGVMWTTAFTDSQQYAG